MKLSLFIPLSCSRSPYRWGQRMAYAKAGAGGTCCLTHLNALGNYPGAQQGAGIGGVIASALAARLRSKNDGEESSGLVGDCLFPSADSPSLAPSLWDRFDHCPDWTCA